MPPTEIVMGKSDSGLHVALHPLVLLTISDYITRHTLRQYTTPIIGALLGQQNGRETTIEHAFELKSSFESTGARLDAEWFETRLQQMRDVHKEPILDLVGWYTTMPESGPQLYHVPIQATLNMRYPECTLLLGFHPTAVLDGTVGGKLPLTIYETTVDSLNAVQDNVMSDDVPEHKITYKEVPYTVETGEAEMISVDFVAKGGGNATAVTAAGKTKEEARPSSSKNKGKEVDQVKKELTSQEEQNALSKEDEEHIAALTAKANAVKMLRSRINLIATFLEKLPPAYVKGEPFDAATASAAGHTTVDHDILRSVQALLSRLALLIPSDTTAFNEELLAEQNDVNLVNLLDALTKSMVDARETGRKFQIVEQGRLSSKKSGGHNGDMFLPPMEGQWPKSAGDLML